MELIEFVSYDFFTASVLLWLLLDDVDIMLLKTPRHLIRNFVIDLVFYCRYLVMSD